MKHLLKSYFSFSRKEYNGVFILCLLIASLVFTPAIYQLFQKETVYDFKTFEKEIIEFKASQKEINKPIKYIDSKGSRPVYFDFNPNGLAVEQWQKLGLADWQIKMIKNYEAKGGHFYKKEDLQKIYAIKAEQYIKLAPYIHIPITKNIQANLNSKSTTQMNLPIININQADSVTLETVRGIGPAFASRILKYRNRLGGFYHTEQLREVYGIDSLKFDQIKNQINTHGQLQKININTASFDELKKHPYLSYKQISTIIRYRQQHGNYKEVLDLKKIIVINDETLVKIVPYLDF